MLRARLVFFCIHISGQVISITIANQDPVGMSESLLQLGGSSSVLVIIAYISTAKNSES